MELRWILCLRLKFFIFNSICFQVRFDLRFIWFELYLMRPITDEKVIVEFGVGRAIVRRKTSVLLADVEDFALVRGIAVIAVRVAVAVGGRVWCGVGAGIVSLDVAGHENFAVAQGGGGCTRTGNPGNGRDKRIFFKNVSQPTKICISYFKVLILHFSLN